VPDSENPVPSHQKAEDGNEAVDQGFDEPRDAKATKCSQYRDRQSVHQRERNPRNHEPYKQDSLKLGFERDSPVHRKSKQSRKCSCNHIRQRKWRSKRSEGNKEKPFDYELKNANKGVPEHLPPKIAMFRHAQ